MTPAPPPYQSDVVTVYTLPRCVACDTTKRHLGRLGVPFVAVPLDDDLVETFKAQGHLAAPIVVTPDGEVWSGYRYDRVKALAR